MATNKTQAQEGQVGQEKQWRPNLAIPKQEPLLRGSVGAVDAASGVNSPKQYVPKPAFNGLTTNRSTNWWLLSNTDLEKAGIAIGGVAAAAAAAATAAYFSIRGLRSFLRRPEETELPVRQATEARGRQFQSAAQVHPGGSRPSTTVGMGGGVQLTDFGIPRATEATMPQGFVSMQPTGVGQPTGPGVRFGGR